MTLTSAVDKTGKAVDAQPIKFKKSIDGASPQLVSALFSHETLDQVRLDLLPTAKNATGGSQGPVETIILTDAEVVSVEQDSDEGTETVALAYGSFTLTNAKNKTSASDKWVSK